jgi:hypothetical protein
VAADVLLRLSALTGEERYQRPALASLRAVAPLMGRYPSGFGRSLAALDFHLGPPLEIALVWPADGPETGLAPLLREVRRRYLPARVVTGGPAGPAILDASPLLAGKGAIGGRPTAYVCERYACQAPTTEAADLGRQLDGRAPTAGPDHAGPS